MSFVILLWRCSKLYRRWAAGEFTKAEELAPSDLFKQSRVVTCQEDCLGPFQGTSHSLQSLAIEVRLNPQILGFAQVQPRDRILHHHRHFMKKTFSWSSCFPFKF